MIIVYLAFENLSFSFREKSLNFWAAPSPACCDRKVLLTIHQKYKAELRGLKVAVAGACHLRLGQTGRIGHPHTGLAPAHREAPRAINF